MKGLQKDISIEVDRITKEEWSNLLIQFNDATIYQTWEYGMVRWGEKNLSHFLLKKQGEVVGMAQVSIKRIPFLRCGIAYIPWGPLWRKKGANEDWEIFRQMLRALRNEYADRRGLLLRIAPNEIESPEKNITGILEEEGYVQRGKPYRTILVELSPALEDLRKRLSRRWRKALKDAESHGLQIREERSDKSLDILREIYGETVSRKGFIPGVSIDEFCQVHKELPERFKMKVLICEHQGEPVSAIMASLLGNKGIPLIGGSRANGLNLGSFYFLNWKLIEWMKSQGAEFYDFGGYDPEKNPGTALFKVGVGGKDVFHVGHFEALGSLLSGISVHWLERIRDFSRKARSTFKALKKSSKESTKQVSEERQEG